jgi:16S rRNA (uracil1498-N3)-methyltransferase
MHGPCAFLVGPEGGFAPAEVELLRRHPFLQAVHLGPRILRAETAAIVGLALLQAGVGG